MTAISIPRKHWTIPVRPELDRGNGIGKLILGGVTFSGGQQFCHDVQAPAGFAPVLEDRPSVLGSSLTALNNSLTPNYAWSNWVGYPGESTGWTGLAMACWAPGGKVPIQLLMSITVGSPNNSYQFVGIQAHYTSGIRAIHRGASTVVTGYFSPLELCPIAVVYKPGVSLSILSKQFKDTVSTTVTGFYGGGNTQQGMHFGADTSGGRITFGHYLPYALDDAAVDDWLENPLQIYCPPEPIRIYSLPSGPISINSITASNITQTGARITLGVTR